MQALEKSETKVELEDLGVSPHNLEGVSSGVGNTDGMRNLDSLEELGEADDAQVLEEAGTTGRPL